jgi:hypothetical protein
MGNRRLKTLAVKTVKIVKRKNDGFVRVVSLQL